MEYGYSCMGYEIAGAMGVRMARPEQEVYALVGDGSFLMLHSELVSSLQYDKKSTLYFSIILVSAVSIIYRWIMAELAKEPNSEIPRTRS